MSRRIAIVTGSRAEYGLLRPLIQQISEDAELELLLIVTGMHLSAHFGNTWQQIEADGFKIDRKVDIALESDSPEAIAHSMALGITGLTKAYQQLRPDIVVLLGDRFEILAASQAAMICQLPIAHLHGGEATEGLIDEAIRHSISKMAHLHFASTETYRRRIIQLGENPARVFNVGALAVDNMRKLALLDRQTLETSLGFSLGQCNFLITYHPMTLSDVDSLRGIESLLTALDAFPDCHVIFTRPNADTGGREIDRLLDDYVANNSQRCAIYAALGTQRYMSAIRQVDVVIGNSSSGLIEVPVMHTPSVNIGDRQRGRLRPQSVVDCSDNAKDIITAINKALSDEFKQTLRDMPPPYGNGNTAELICDILKKADLSNILYKSFHDLEVST